jgi:hypothetical protein
MLFSEVPFMNLSTPKRAGLASFFASSFAALALLLVATPASAQDEAPPAAPAAPAPATPGAPDAKVPSFSLALERVGGLAYAKASESNGNSSLSVTAFGIGGVTPNPFAIPRIGGDFILGSGLTLGGAIGFSRVSASATTSSGKSEDIGSVFLYTVTPRVGYRIPLSERVDLTPRAGLTFAGASASPANSNNDASIFALAIGADAPFAFRLTDSFNLLAGAAIDYTVSAKVTTTTTSTTSGGTTGTTTRTQSDDVKGSLFSLQGWIGIGGYL